MKQRKFRTFDEARIERYRKHPEELKGYIRIALEEYQKDGNEKAFLSALSMAARVNGGFSRLARGSGLNREHLYRALSDRTDPRFSTIVHVLNTLNFSLKIA